MNSDTEERISRLHERVSGCYRMLQTLVAIRLRSVTDPESRRHLVWLSDVAAAFSLFNDRLSDREGVDFAAYVQDAAAFWRRQTEPAGIRIQVRTVKATLPELHALSLAIVAHELVANAIRHGFPEGRRGTVAIAFSRASSGVSLVVRDSGVGGGDLKYGDGLHLVEGLVQHMNGTMSVEAAEDGGVGVRIRLPLDGDETAH